MKKSLFFAFAIIILSAFTNPFAYQLFDAEGNETDYEKLLEKAKEADIILFGELHNNPIAHWLQLRLTKDLYKKKLY